MADILVVGAGQLGLMMAAAGARLGISVDRLDHVTGEVLPGTSRSRLSLSREEILARYPLITAELEHLLGNAMVERLRNESAWCNAQAMSLLPARDRQKTLLDRLDIATSPWLAVDTPQDLDDARLRLGDALVMKSIRDGYDGKGQWVVGPGDDGGIPDEAYGRIIAERLIPFEREVSLVGARFRGGGKAFFPLVENYHQGGMLRYTLAPAAGSRTLQDDAEDMLGRILDSLDYVGVMAMECFETPGGLLVNELAPRVHNSGHWTQVGAGISQFDLHVLALLDRLPVELPVKQGVSLMLNLIGCRWNPAWQGLDGIQCWWYGKSWREHRKLGHVNIHARDIDCLVQAAGNLMETLDQFHSDMLALAMSRVLSR